MWLGNLRLNRDFVLEDRKSSVRYQEMVHPTPNDADRPSGRRRHNHQNEKKNRHDTAVKPSCTVRLDAISRCLSGFS